MGIGVATHGVWPRALPQRWRERPAAPAAVCADRRRHRAEPARTVVGLVLWLAPFALAFLLAVRTNEPPGAIAAFAVVAAIGLWSGLGLVAGLPLDAVTWLGFGLAAAAAARTLA